LVPVGFVVVVVVVRVRVGGRDFVVVAGLLVRTTAPVLELPPTTMPPPFVVVVVPATARPAVVGRALGDVRTLASDEAALALLGLGVLATASTFPADDDGRGEVVAGRVEQPVK